MENDDKLITLFRELVEFRKDINGFENSDYSDAHLTQKEKEKRNSILVNIEIRKIELKNNIK